MGCSTWLHRTAGRRPDGPFSRKWPKSLAGRQHGTHGGYALRLSSQPRASSHGGSVMSDRVTWETCTTCGELAALGWTLVEGAHGEPVGEVLVEIDCPSGCRVVS